MLNPEVGGVVFFFFWGGGGVGVFCVYFLADLLGVFFVGFFGGIVFKESLVYCHYIRHQTALF